MGHFAEDVVRRATGLDALAHGVARVLPRALAADLEQARLDASVILGALTGRHPAPCRSRRAGLSRIPLLDEVDPLSALLPRPLASVAHQAARDVASVWGVALGRRPPPVVSLGRRRRPRRARAGAETLARVLRIADVFVASRSGAATGLWLEDPTGRPVEFSPGQFFTLLVNVGGVTHRRAYSVSSPRRPDGRIRLVVKRIEGGVVSNHIGDTFEPGGVVSVLGPSGSFTLEPEPGRARHHVFLGGGSGITPLLAMIHGVLEGEPESRVTLIYGNRTAEDVILEDELRGLAEEHSRFEVRLVLSEPPEGWSGSVGVLDARTLRAELDRLELGRGGLAASYFLCGPEPMMEAAKLVLAERGVAERDVAVERFVAAARRSAERPAEAQIVTLRRRGRAEVFRVAPGESILDAGLGAGVEMGFSCAMGGCAECRLRLVEGEVAMDEPNCLTDEERAEGLILACVGWPMTAVTLEAS